MVTLSCLIVMASLFAQLSTTLPASAEPKAIEVLFFFYIAKLSFVFLCHTLLGYILYRRKRKESQDLIKNNKIHAEEGLTPVVPLKPFQYEPPVEKKYKISLNNIDQICAYGGILVEIGFLAYFFKHIFESRQKIIQILNQNN